MRRQDRGRSRGPLCLGCRLVLLVMIVGWRLWFGQEMPVDEPLHLRMQVGLGLLDGEEGVIAFVVEDETIKLQALQRQEDKVHRAEARVRHAPGAFVDQ